MPKPSPSRPAAQKSSGSPAPLAFSPERKFAEALTAWQDGKPREAETLAAQLVKAVPAHAHGWFIRGLAVEALGKPAVALKHFEQVKDAPDLLFGVAQARGRAHLALSQTELAVSHLQESLALQADDAQSHYLLALAVMQQGAQDDGRRLLRQATLLDPSLGAAHFELGVMYLQQGDYAKAQTSCELAVKYLPGVALPLNNLALALKAQGMLKEAAEQFERAVAVDAKFADAWGNLFIVRSELGVASAAQARAQAVKLSPQLAELLDAAVGRPA